MYRVRDLMLALVSGGLLFGSGVWTGQSIDPLAVHAQSQADRYEIYHNPLGTNRWYTLKHDRQTGDTWVLSGKGGADNDEWLLLPEKDKRKK